MIGEPERSVFDGVVTAGKRYVLVTHLNPDGDAIGSEVGLGAFLEHLGCPYRIVNQDATPESLRFLEAGGPASETYDPSRHDPVLDAADVIVLLDNSAPDRLGRLEPAVLARAGKTLCIDHHPTRGTPWRWNVIVERASATGAMVHELVRARGFRHDVRSATALYAALATDTGFFRFNSATPEAHRIAAELLEAGAESARCYAEVYERNAPAYTRLLGNALASLRLDHDGAVASIRVTRAMTEACGADGIDTSELTTPVLATDGVRIAILFRELGDGRTKVSLRSKGELNVHALAAEFGGGGHRNASGIVLDDALEPVAARVIARAGDLLEGRGPQ